MLLLLLVKLKLQLLPFGTVLSAFCFGLWWLLCLGILLRLWLNVQPIIHSAIFRACDDPFRTHKDSFPWLILGPSRSRTGSATAGGAHALYHHITAFDRTMGVTTPATPKWPRLAAIGSLTVWLWLRKRRQQTQTNRSNSPVKSSLDKIKYNYRHKINMNMIWNQIMIICCCYQSSGAKTLANKTAISDPATLMEIVFPAILLRAMSWDQRESLRTT